MSVEGLGRCVMVIPTYNEAENLEWIVGRLRTAQPGVDVLVVDDNSPDGEVVASVPARGQEVLLETIGLSTTITPAVRLGVWPARVVLTFLVLHTAYVVITYRRRRRGDRAVSSSVERSGTA